MLQLKCFMASREKNSNLPNIIFSCCQLIFSSIYPFHIPLACAHEKWHYILKKTLQNAAFCYQIWNHNKNKMPVFYFPFSTMQMKDYSYVFHQENFRKAFQLSVWCQEEHWGRAIHLPLIPLQPRLEGTFHFIPAQLFIESSLCIFVLFTRLPRAETTH